MDVLSVSLHDFRCYERAAAPLGGGVTLIVGPNGAGKTNLLEAVYFACTGRSCRTTNDREVVRFGAPATHLEAVVAGVGGSHQLCVGFEPGQPKRMSVDGAPVERLADSPQRPLVSVFLPDRLELVKGSPSLRRAHLDHVIAALWPSRVATRRAFNQALAQRNALLTRLRSAAAAADSALTSWTAQLAGAAVALMADRAQAVELLAPAFTEICGRLGLDGHATLSYRPRSRAGTADELAFELDQRVGEDLRRGFTTHGPHRDEVELLCDRRELRTFGSQGQQRVAVLGLLLAEREVITATRSEPPLMLLDDVMSELDRHRRSALIDALMATPGQALITATDGDDVPGGELGELTTIEVHEGVLADVVGAGGWRS